MADHIGTVDVGGEEQIALGLEVDIILVNLHDFRGLAIEESAFDFMSALSGGDAHVDGSGEVAGLVSFDFFNFNIALFSHAGGINKVNAFLQNGVQ